MKNIRFYEVLLAMLIICEGVAFGSPKAVPYETRYNAGGVSQGTMIQHDFVIKNTGSETLTLKAQDCGCGGVKAKTPGSIKPGKSDMIKVSIPTINLQGNYKREIKIETNDPDNKEIVLKITANINETLSITPKYINFGKGMAGSKLSKELMITNTGKDKITILGVRVYPPGAGSISPVMGKTILKPNEKKRLELNLNPRNKPGYFQGQVIIITDIKNLEEKKVFFGAEIIAN
jgi:hypothetical protein